MINTKRQRLIEIAEKLAFKPFHGKLIGLSSNIDTLINYFPDGPRKDFDGKWCAAFVYHCCVLAGFNIPYRYPDKRLGTFAGVKAWIQWAKLHENQFYYSSKNKKFTPMAGDIVIYDNVFDPSPHDHIGIILAVNVNSFRVAEGNVNNLSCVLERKMNKHIRGFIRIPNNYEYK